MNKKEMLKEKIRALAEEDMCVAFSGGVDSGLLLKMACEACSYTEKKVYALTMDTVLHPRADIDTAGAVAKEMGAEHIVLRINELTDARIKNNPRERCYLCKKALYTKMREFACKRNISVLIDGTNEDDLHVDRPGLKAVRELGVYTPLADCGLTKKEVRKLAGEYGISVAERPSSPVLPRAFLTGRKLILLFWRKLTEEKKKLRNLGFGDVRIRVHGTILRLEIQFCRISPVY